MSFEEAYGYYTHTDLNSYQAGTSGYVGDQGPYYPPSMHPSYDPQVGPSSSAQFDYEDPFIKSISELSNHVNTLGQ